MKRLSTRRRTGAPRVSFSDQLSDAIWTVVNPRRFNTAIEPEPFPVHEHRWYATKYPDGRKCDECGSWQMWGTY